MIDPRDLRIGVIRPALERLPGIRNDRAVEDLLIGTVAQESRGGFELYQVGGPALGIYQIEPDTHTSIWDNYLAYRPDLASAVRSLGSQGMFESMETFHNELVTNLKYATAIARIKYLPKPERIPDDLEGQAQYWKDHFNTSEGSGRVETYLKNYHRYVTKFEDN